MFQADDNLRVKNRDKELEEAKRKVPTANLKELTCAQFAFIVYTKPKLNQRMA